MCTEIIGSNSTVRARMNHSLETNNVLSKKDATDLLDIIHGSIFCSTETDFRRLIQDMKRIIPFDFAACLRGRKTNRRRLAQFELINISYPDEWLITYMAKSYQFVDPIVRENFACYPLQYWRDTYRKYAFPKQFVKEAEDFGLRKGYSIGQKNFQLTEGSLFSFAGDTIERHRRTESILTHVAPHLHRAFNQVLDRENKASSAVRLTAREKEVLHWLKEGKSTWDISVILAISQDTVNFHLKNIYRKLNTGSRAHAVAVALGMKLIDF